MLGPPEPEDKPQPSSALISITHVRVLCALLASACLFIPVPFLDDMARERIVQIMVSRTLKAHDRSFTSGRVKPLWGDGGCLSGCLMFVIKLPLKLLLFPIRKVLAVLTSVRTLSADLTKMLLLGRAIDRALDRGMLVDGPNLEEEARVLREAYDAAARRFDTTLLQRYLVQALGQVSGLSRAAMRGARRLFRRGEGADIQEDLGPSASTVEEGAAKVEEVMEQPEIVALLERFDRAMDDRLAAAGLLKTE